MKNGEGIKQKYIYTTVFHIDTVDSTVVAARRKGGREVGWAKGRYIGMERDLILSGEHTMKYACDVLLCWALENCMVLLTNVTPINSIKNSILTPICL